MFSFQRSVVKTVWAPLSFINGAQYGGMDTSIVKRLKELEDENRRSKKMYAEARLNPEIRKEALKGKL